MSIYINSTECPAFSSTDKDKNEPITTNIQCLIFFCYMYTGRNHSKQKFDEFKRKFNDWGLAIAL